MRLEWSFTKRQTHDIRQVGLLPESSAVRADRFQSSFDSERNVRQFRSVSV